MKNLNTLLAALTFLGTSMAVQAADDTFASVTYGQTSDKVKKSGLLTENVGNLNSDGIIGKDDTWGIRLGKINE